MELFNKEELNMSTTKRRQERYIPKKITDGEGGTWWRVWDEKNQSFSKEMSMRGTYRNKRDCERAIIEHQEFRYEW
jgi:mannose/cellobiose epimerase-like protein (N-acyl-D-glucosamine 2-epimerase family)